MRRNKLMGIGLTFILLLLRTTMVEARNNSFVYDDKGKRDPFWNLVSSSGNLMNYETDLQMTDLLLEGIMVGADGQNLAVINSKVVKIHDTIDQFVVVRIDKNRVVLTKDQKNFELKLKKEE